MFTGGNEKIPSDPTRSIKTFSTSLLNSWHLLISHLFIPFHFLWRGNSSRSKISYFLINFSGTLWESRGLCGEKGFVGGGKEKRVGPRSFSTRSEEAKNHSGGRNP